MIYLNKDHNIKDKYEDSDWIKTPLVIFLNNTYDLLIKKEVMKCNLGEMIARENIEKGHSMGLEQGQKLERITLIKNMTESLQCSMQRAMDVLKLTADERKDVEEYFKS